MAKHDKDRAKKQSGKPGAVPGVVKVAVDTVAKALDDRSGGHHAAKAHGQAATVDASLPGTREQLMARHADARKRRNTAALDSEAFRAAVDELGRIEVRIAAIERDQVPPKG